MSSHDLAHTTAEHASTANASEMAPVGQQGGSAAVECPPATTSAGNSPASPLNRTIRASFVPEALVPAPVEARVSEAHLRLLTDNARQMEGGADDSRWFTSPEVHDAAAADVKLASCQSGGFIAIRAGSRVLRFDLVTIFSEIVVCGIVLVVAWLVLGTAMEPGGAVFAAALTILVGSLLGSLLASLLGLPPLVGMLLAGMTWGNLPGGLASGMSPDFYKFLRNFAVAVILSRAGLTFKWKLTKPVITNVTLMSMVPQLLEVVGHAAIAMWLFGDKYPTFTFAIYQGAAIAASSTAVVIPAVSALQEKGYGATRGPGVLMLCSIAGDAVFAIWFTSFVFELVFSEGTGKSLILSVEYRLATAPIQILAGAAAGIATGLLSHLMFNAFHARVATESPLRQDTAEKFARMKCLVLSTALGVGTIFLCYRLNFPGSGTVAVVCAAGSLAHLWGKTPEMDHRRQLLYKDTARALSAAKFCSCLYGNGGMRTLSLGSAPSPCRVTVRRLWVHCVTSSTVVEG
jgi:hypothetical protein